MSRGIALVKPPRTAGAAIFDEFFLTSVQLDVTVSATHTRNAEWAKHPVESGIDITDHVDIKAAQLQINGIVSDTPLGAQGLPFPDRSKDAWSTLVALLEAGRLLTVVTGLQVYRNMGMSGLSANENAANGQSVRPSVTLEEQRIVNSAFAAVPEAILEAAVSATAATETNGGKQATTLTSPTEAAAVDPSAEFEAAASGQFDDILSGDKSLFATGQDFLSF